MSLEEVGDGDEGAENKGLGIALVGFGEAARAFADGWRADTRPAISAYDIKTESADADIAAAKWQDYRDAGVTGHSDLSSAFGNAAIVFSLVTADQALTAARNAAPHLPKGAFYADCNSCAPDTKRAAAELVRSAGGRYVDVAIMAPVHPALHRTPLLVSGPGADAAKHHLDTLGMNAAIVSANIGDASSVKMVRSVIMKGLEALVVESLVAGERAGVSDQVLASLDQTYPGFDWRKRADYMLERVTRHGLRRAAELREVAVTLTDLGIDPIMSQAAVLWQERVGAMEISSKEQSRAARISEMLRPGDIPPGTGKRNED